MRLGRRLQSIAAFAAERRPVRLFFADEARIGLHLPRYRRLTARGVAPRYRFYWLYAAVEPRSGETFYLEMPSLDAECFSVFLREFGRCYGESLNVLVLDNAAAHRARSVEVPENVVLLFLPAYSPEPSPVERLWRAIRARLDVFDARVRSQLEALRAHVAEIVRGLRAVEVSRLTRYDYILAALNAL
ncbi:transposase [Rhodothermus marinus]|uniref:transposase n=1 Tax=Rhodothermus marinus TaxID=29549 RepID=UPI001E61080B|nr:transposase [Rhodothermus marinus]